MKVECGSCGAEIERKVAELTGWLLQTLGPVRREALTTIYRDNVPNVLCAECFISTGDMVNLAAFSNEKGKVPNL